MNRLVLVPCIVVACYVAAASYFASYIVYLLDRPRDGFPIPTFASNRGEILKESSSQQPSSVHLSYEIPNKPVGENPAVVVLPERPRQEAMLVTVLLPARVHTGPSVDTPINHFYGVGTPLHATSYQNDWFEISEPGTSKSGWIYRKYLGAISNSEQNKMALQEAEGQKPVAEVPALAKRHAKAAAANRYAKAVPAKRYASTIGFSRKSSPAASKPNRGRTEMASLLQRAFSGY
jgi:hypothetical protein